jgi:hypothetical protein
MATAPAPQPTTTAIETAALTATKAAVPSSATAIPSATAPVTRFPITLSPTDIRRPTRTVSAATLAAKATIRAYGAMCEGPAEPWEAEISRDGLWIAISCWGDNADVDSHLRVVSLQDKNNWVIHFADYANGAKFDRNDSLYPFHWSQDGRYLYAASRSKASGCCWIGDNRLLVRLNLENGQQTEVVNFGRSVGVDFSFSSSDRYFLYIPQVRDNLYILDLLTWQVRVIKLEFENTGAGYTVMSDNDEKIVLMLREYPQEIQGDLTYGSIIVIDLGSGSQRKLLSGLEYEQTPRPVRWTDADHVLLSGSGKAWLLDINTAELAQIVEP